MTTDELAAKGSGMTGALNLEWVKDGVEDWKAVTPYGTYYCIRTFSDMSALWLDNKKLGNYGGGSHAEAKKAAQAHFNGHRPAALAASSEVQALIREAEARGMERAADTLLQCSVWCDGQARTDGGWRNGVADARKHGMAAIRAEADVIRGEGK